ncbi:hypothetical protein [Micromonospora rubida]|uniref:hypothetical protein n=1 Tax=Micromonospora rubida TaxID=2697657 RepID=UPI00137893A3|nr:hypothetical protein [Micromonospora rubida]
MDERTEAAPAPPAGRLGVTPAFRGLVLVPGGKPRSDAAADRPRLHVADHPRDRPAADRYESGQHRHQIFGTVRQVNPPSRHASTARALGNVALVAGFLVSAITLSTSTGTTEPHILAGFLIAAGVGLRIEAAIVESRT